jgi:uncharacterized SAM-binding protein YcdF (DUF218 family)
MDAKTLFHTLNTLLRKRRIESSDAIVWLQGDRYDRAGTTFDLYRRGTAPFIVISGNNALIGEGKRPGENNISLEEMESWLLKRGVPRSAILFDSSSMNTRDQSLNISVMAKERGWKACTIVGSYPHYQGRYYLTFLRGQKEAGWDGRVIPAAVMLDPLQIPGGRDRPAGELMEEEFEKIIEYQRKGHVAPFEEGIEALERWDRERGKGEGN